MDEDDEEEFAPDECQACGREDCETIVNGLCWTCASARWHEEGYTIERDDDDIPF